MTDAAPAADPAAARIEFDGSIALISGLEIRRPEVVDYLRKLEPAEREPALLHAVEVGIFCLERAQASRDTEFVRRQVQGLMADVEQAVGKVPASIETALAAKIGSGEGQLLAPVDAVVKVSVEAVTSGLAEVKKLFAEELDPSKETAALGSALRTVRDRLDPAREDSIQGAVRAAVRSVTGGDGALAKSVRDVVAEAIKPLKEEFDALAKEMRGQEAAREALEQTTQKGATYETQVVEELQAWAKIAGAQVDHVGADNRPGDAVVVVTASSLIGEPLRIVVEARDRQTAAGRKVIADTMVKAIREREADCAIYVSARPSGLGADIGDFAEGETEAGRFIACAHPNLAIALRLLVTQARIDRAADPAAELNLGLIVDQIARVRSAMERIKTINRRATDVRKGADGIDEEARALRDDIRDAMAKIEDAIHLAEASPQASEG